ncbi:hypothetical protein BCR44DRAFT_1266282 [Catenaria anguillulae PL171]|uniref:Secreted protein n=1 Tax=Catenaria anguillulae PL171 TaxID=765915 RepID=A0A1Y2HWM6_9FUNG|nr:hypothetical protein BCR44DRAFT_1266282 [Catenaria anguillulae PL171]
MRWGLVIVAGILILDGTQRGKVRGIVVVIVRDKTLRVLRSPAPRPAARRRGDCSCVAPARCRRQRRTGVFVVAPRMKRGAQLVSTRLIAVTISTRAPTGLAIGPALMIILIIWIVYIHQGQRQQGLHVLHRQLKLRRWRGNPPRPAALANGLCMCLHLVPTHFHNAISGKHMSHKHSCLIGRCQVLLCQLIVRHARGQTRPVRQRGLPRVRISATWSDILRVLFKVRMRMVVQPGHGPV